MLASQGNFHNTKGEWQGSRELFYRLTDVQIKIYPQANCKAKTLYLSSLINKIFISQWWQIRKQEGKSMLRDLDYEL